MNEIHLSGASRDRFLEALFAEPKPIAPSVEEAIEAFRREFKAMEEERRRECYRLDQAMLEEKLKRQGEP